MSASEYTTVEEDNVKCACSSAKSISLEEAKIAQNTKEKPNTKHFSHFLWFRRGDNVECGKKKKKDIIEEEYHSSIYMCVHFFGLF